MDNPFERVGLRLVAGAGDGLENFAAAVMASSLEQCPVDTGVLRGSSMIDHAREVGGTLRTTFGYGYGDEVNPKTRRVASEYAVPVHERLEAYHEPPTKAKFLEDPLLEHAMQMGPIVAAAMRDALEFRVVPLPGINIMGAFPVIAHLRTGQPIVRTPHGPRFARRRHHRSRA